MNHNNLSDLLKIKEAECRLALLNTSKQLFLYDLETSTAILPKEMAEDFDFHEVAAKMPGCFFDAGLVVPESKGDFKRFFKEIHGNIPTGSNVSIMEKKHGQQLWARFDYILVRDEQGLPFKAVISYEDVSKQMEKEQAYAKWRQSYKTMNQLSFNYFEFNLTRSRFERCEGALRMSEAQVLQRDCEEFLRELIEEFVFPEDREAVTSFFDKNRLLNQYHLNYRDMHIEYRQKDREGRYIWVACALQLLPDPYSADIKGCSLLRNIDKEKRHEIGMKRVEQSDSLTGLLNRAATIQHISELLEMSNNESWHAIIMLDMDFFRQINELHGRIAGDRILQEIAKDLKKITRENDIVGRLGEDEFIICLKHLPVGRCFATMERRVAAIGHRIAQKNYQGSRITASIGAAIYPRDGITFDKLYQKADVSLYEAKRQGKNQYVIFGSEMKGVSCDTGLSEERFFEKLFEEETRSCLEHQALELYLRPQVDMSGVSRITGAQAVGRWKGSQGDVEIPVKAGFAFSQNPVLAEVDFYMFRQVCNYIKEREQQGKPLMPIEVSVSEATLLNLENAEQILDCVHSFQIPQGTLYVESTERMVLQQEEQWLAFTQVLEQGGIGSVVSGVEQGRGLRNSLERRPVAAVKLCMKPYEGESERAQELERIEALAKQMKEYCRDIIVEAVETSSQMEWLVGAGFQRMQGGVIGKPVLVQEFESVYSAVYVC